MNYKSPQSNVINNLSEELATTPQKLLEKAEQKIKNIEIEFAMYKYMTDTKIKELIKYKGMTLSEYNACKAHKKYIYIHL